MTLNLQDRRVIAALAGIFTLGLACVLLMVLAALTLCALLLNALVGTIAEIFSTIGTLYAHGGPLTHLVMLLGLLLGIPYSFKRLRTPILRFLQQRFARFTAFAQQQRTSPVGDTEDLRDDRDYEEGEVIDLDAAGEEKVRQAHTTAANPTASRNAPATNKRHKKKRPRHQAKPQAPAMLALARP